MRTELDPARNQLEAAKTETENPTFSTHPVQTYRSDSRTLEFIQALNTAAANIQKSVQSEEEIFRTFTEQVTSMGLRGGLAILDESGASATIRALAQPPGLLRKLSRFEKIFGIKVLGYSFPITNVKTYNAVIESRDSLFVADSTSTIAQLLPPFAQPLSRTILGAFGRTATVYTPLIVDGRVIGILNIAGPAITAEDRPAIQAFANHIGIALTNQRLYLEAQREIGERREAQEKLRESEERFRHLWEATLEGIAIHDNGVLVEANPAILRLFGLSREQVIGRSIFEFAPPEAQAVMREKIASGDERPYEATFIRPDGSALILEVTGRNAEYQGRAQRIVSVRDITERKQAEEVLMQFRSVMDESNDAILLIHQESARLVDFNRSVWAWLGYTHEELSRLSYMDIAGHAPNLEAWRQRIDQLRRDENPLIESSYRRKDGSVFPVEINAKLLNLGREPILLAVVRDISERKRTEQAVRKQTEYLESLHRIAIDLLNRRSVEDLLSKIAVQAAALLDSAHSMIFLDDGEALILRAATEDLAHRRGTREVKPGLGLLGRVWQAQAPVAVTQYEDPHYSQENPGSIAGVPIFRGETIAGVLSVARLEADRRPFDADDMEILSRFAQLASLALDNVHLYESALAEIAGRRKMEKALQESERRYRALFQDSPIALWEEDFSNAKRYLDDLRQRGIVDIRAHLAANPDEVSKIAGMVRVVNLNDAALKMYRSHDPAILFGNLAQVLLPETLRSFEEELVALAENRRSFTTESKDRVATGDIIDISLSWKVSPDITDYSRVIVSVVDITERKRAEEIIGQYAVELERRVDERTAELNRINRELAHANRAKDEFLATMSHELRTPLNSILGFSEALLERRRGPLNEKQDEYIRLISASGEHLLRLITDILEVSKIEAGKLSIQPDLISVKEVCESSLNFIRETALKKSISVEFKNEQSVGSLRADPQRLKQVLVNLLNNAVKFTPEHGMVSLEVSIGPEKDRIMFSVRDNGIGIAPSDLKKLFTPFTQLDSSLARQYEGTGLGLVLVYKLTELHGGSVEVESEPGRGSRFSVILPWAEQPDQPVDLASAAEPAAPASPLTGDERLVLLAEDNQANVLAIHEYLLDHGYNVIVARNGLEAIESAEKLRPGIILMDIQMPEMDGLEAIQRLRSNRIFDGTPIVAITALAMPGDRTRCLEAGADEYMSKPVSLRHLLQTIVRLLQ